MTLFHHIKCHSVELWLGTLLSSCPCGFLCLNHCRKQMAPFGSISLQHQWLFLTVSVSIVDNEAKNRLKIAIFYPLFRH